MGTWNSRGLRGSTLEDMINHTNDLYREKKLALIQKIPTPITPVSIDKTSRHITLAYFDQTITSARFRASRSALMQKNARQIHFHCRTSIRIRSHLCGNLKSRAGLLS